MFMEKCLIPVIYLLQLCLSQIILVKFKCNILLKLWYMLSTQVLPVSFFLLNCVLDSWHCHMGELKINVVLWYVSAFNVVQNSIEHFIRVWKLIEWFLYFNMQNFASLPCQGHKCFTTSFLMTDRFLYSLVSEEHSVRPLFCLTVVCHLY